MAVPQVSTWTEPDPGEVRESGFVLYVHNGKVLEAPVCQTCASYMGSQWVPALFEGTCRACECILSGNVH